MHFYVKDYSTHIYLFYFTYKIYIFNNNMSEKREELVFYICFSKIHKTLQYVQSFK